MSANGRGRGLRPSVPVPALSPRTRKMPENATQSDVDKQFGWQRRGGDSYDIRIPAKTYDDFLDFKRTAIEFKKKYELAEERISRQNEEMEILKARIDRYRNRLKNQEVNTGKTVQPDASVKPVAPIQPGFPTQAESSVRAFAGQSMPTTDRNDCKPQPSAKPTNYEAVTQAAPIQNATSTDPQSSVRSVAAPAVATACSKEFRTQAYTKPQKSEAEKKEGRKRSMARRKKTRLAALGNDIKKYEARYVIPNRKK